MLVYQTMYFTIQKAHIVILSDSMICCPQSFRLNDLTFGFRN